MKRFLVLFGFYFVILSGIDFFMETVKWVIFPKELLNPITFKGIVVLWGLSLTGAIFSYVRNGEIKFNKIED